jgi:hypothetical protein
VSEGVAATAARSGSEAGSAATSLSSSASASAGGSRPRWRRSSATPAVAGVGDQARQAWMAWPDTARAASLRASGSVGWA